MQETKSLVVCLPKISESVHSARIVKWLKKEGDHIRLDEALVEVSTAKVNSEIPSPFEGVLTSIKVKETQEVLVGDALCTIENDQHNEDCSQVIEPKEEKKVAFLSPAVLRMAKDHDLCILGLQQMKGTGSDERVTKQDVQKLIQEKTKPQVDRSALKQSIMNSHTNIPDASLIFDLNMQPVVDWMANKRASFEQEYKVKVTYTAHAIQALGQAIKSHTHFQYEGCCNIGIAVQKGQSLVVPVIENVDTLSLDEIASQLQAMQNSDARTSVKTKITLSNFGRSGVQIGLPIVPEGQSAILALGALEKRVIATKQDAIQIQSRAWATLAFDHRVFDGMYGAQFLQELQQAILVLALP